MKAEEFIILCVGTDKVIADSFAPLLGELLVKKNCPFYVYGTISRPVTALNLKFTLEHIKHRHCGKKIFVIDARISLRQGITIEQGNLKVAYSTLNIAVGDYFMALDILPDEISDYSINKMLKNVGTAYYMIKRFLNF